MCATVFPRDRVEKEKPEIDMYSIPCRVQSIVGQAGGILSAIWRMRVYVRNACAATECRNSLRRWNCAKQTVADRPPDHLLAFRNLWGHKISRYYLISSNTRVFEDTCACARASFYCAKGWRTAAMPNEGWAAVIVGKLNFVPEGPSDEVCWQLENLRLTARTRHQAPEYIPGKIFPPSFSLFFFITLFPLYFFFSQVRSKRAQFRYCDYLKIRLDLPWGTHPWWQFSQ